MKVVRLKIYGFGATVGSSAAVMIELPEAICDEAMRLFAIYSEAWTAFHGACDRPARKRAFAVLGRARRIYQEHLKEHRCGRAASLKASGGSVEEQLQAAVLRAQEQLEAAWATYSELRRLSIESGATADGTVTLAEAKLLWRAARLAYTRALRRFSDHVVRRERPRA